ncbi:MAG: hypothetical protein ABFS37_09340, partial [Acidobacteriota bacterium]
RITRLAATANLFQVCLKPDPLAGLSSFSDSSIPITNTTESWQFEPDADAAIVLADCVPIQGDTEYHLGGRFFVQGSQPGDPHILISAILFDGPDCTGSVLTSPSTNNIALTDQWFMKSTTRFTPAEAVSAHFRINVFNDTTDAFQVHGDTMFIIDITPVFNDGFESSDTSAWSITVP